jgi:hypothetical protein
MSCARRGFELTRCGRHSVLTGPVPSASVRHLVPDSWPSLLRVRTLLIDSSHKRWFVATVVLGVALTAVYIALARRAPDGLTGASPVGLWYGVAGSALMVFAGLLSALRRVPSWWWLGRRQTWLRGHIWLGLLSGVVILCHSGFRWGGPLELVLWVVLVAVLASGVLGLLAQQFLPRLITTHVPAEAPFEQIPHLCLTMRKKADVLIDGLCGPGDAKDGGLSPLRRFYEEEVRPFLSPDFRRASPLADPARAEAAFDRVRSLPALAAAREQLTTLAAWCDERRQLGEQERVHYWLHAWLLVHVPLSAALLVLGLTHAVLSLYY